MALIAESKGFTAADEDTTDCVSLTSSVWGSEAPKTHLLFAMGNSAAAVNTDIQNSIGWSDGTDNVAIGNGSENGQGTSICNRTHQTAYTAYPLGNNGAIYERAVQSSYSNAPRVCHTWSSSANDAYYYWLMALGGSDVENISIDTVASPTSAGDVSYTGVGFQADLVWIKNRSHGGNWHDVYDVIRILIEEVEEMNQKGKKFDVAVSVAKQLPFFVCVNL